MKTGRGQRDAINPAIQLPNTKAESIARNEDQKGIYTATYTALPRHRFKSTATDVRLGERSDFK